jgi:hypothetical protein
MVCALRKLWPVAVFVGAGIVGQTVWSAGFDVSGHAAGHLQSATAIFAMTAMLAIVAWAMPVTARRDPIVWVLIAVTIASCALVMVGNVRVVDAINGEVWTDAQADLLGADRPGFASGHALAERAALASVAGTVLLAAWLWRRKVVSPKTAAGAGLLSLVFPSFIAPGFGVVVLAVAGAVARWRRADTA